MAQPPIDLRKLQVISDLPGIACASSSWMTPMDLPETLISPARQFALSAATFGGSSVRCADLVVAKLTYATGRDPMVASDRDWFVATALALRDRIVERWLSSRREDTARQSQARLLSVAGIPARPHAAGLAEQLPASPKPMRAGAGRARRRSRSAAHAGAGPGAGQRRPWPPGRLLHGEHGEPGHPRPWLRHPLQSWPVPAGDPRRLAARISRRPGCRSAIPGSSSVPTSVINIGFGGRDCARKPGLTSGIPTRP